MSEISRNLQDHADALARALEPVKKEQSGPFGKAMAELCDKRIAKARKAIEREEKYLFKLLRARNTGGIMAGDIEGAFSRLRTALDTPVR